MMFIEEAIAAVQARDVRRREARGGAKRVMGLKGRGSGDGAVAARRGHLGPSRDPDRG
jgi:hypothetical protein